MTPACKKLKPIIILVFTLIHLVKGEYCPSCNPSDNNTEGFFVSYILADFVRWFGAYYIFNVKSDLHCWHCRTSIPELLHSWLMISEYYLFIMPSLGGGSIYELNVGLMVISVVQSIKDKCTVSIQDFDEYLNVFSNFLPQKVMLKILKWCPPPLVNSKMIYRISCLIEHSWTYFT